MKKTILHVWHKEHGGDMVEFGGWEMPIRYETGIIQEHLATRKYGGLFDVSHMGRFLITGEQATDFLQYILTNNAAALEAGQSQYTVIPNENGGAIDDSYLYKINQKDYILVVNASNIEKDWRWFQKQIKKFSEANLEDKSEKISMLALQGPKAKMVLENILHNITELPDVGRNNLSVTEFENEQVIISRTGYTGEPLCFELFVPQEKTIALWERILKVGKKYNIIPAGLGARDSLRLEASLPLYGHEFGEDKEGKEIPILAVPIAKYAVSFSSLKGEFIGKEALNKQFLEYKQLENRKQCQKQYLPKRIMPIAIASIGAARQGDEVYINNRLIGEVRSGSMVSYWKFDKEGVASHITEEKGKRSICLAYIDSETEKSQEVQIHAKGRILEGVVVERHLSSAAPPYSRTILVKTKEKHAEEGKGLSLLMEKLVGEAIENHVWRQKKTINLIPSEQTPSKLVRFLTSMDPSGRYAEHKMIEALGESEIPYYQGTEFIIEKEGLLIEEMTKFLGCSQVEPRIISGQQANKTVFSALVDYKNRLDKKTEPQRLRKVMNNHLGKGGHLSAQPLGALRHYVMVDPVTEKPAVINFPIQKDNPYKIDLEETGQLIDEHKPELIILGKSMVLHPEPVAEIRKRIDTMEDKPVLMYDMAHVLGLIGPYFQEPFKEGADIVTGSTHKTFFGPQRGVVAGNMEEETKEYELWETIQREAFPGSTSNHHLGTLLGLLMAAYEMNMYGKAYQKQVISNAKAFAKALRDNGFNVEGDPDVSYTETHQIILNVGYANGAEIAEKLEKNNIIVNYQSIPYDEGFSSSSALRMGVQEMTRFGMKEKDFEELAGHIKEVILEHKDIGAQIARFRGNFTEMAYCLPEEKSEPLIKKLLRNTV
ncbi:MAG: glycine cleavage system aminomethyltransferase GcvT [Deltaproteobacteria bacterium]|nr:glycine cleavage system aminomethyltransferase GcvT [Deltaproteobacteria bacterium]